MSSISENFPRDLLEKWQNITNLLEKIVDVPAALIMRTENEFMEVFVSSDSESNPYYPGNKEHWQGSYCETVIKSQNELLVPDALKDKNGDKNPEVQKGMIAFLGIPLNFPDKKPFGTICVLDSNVNEFRAEDKALLYQFKNVIELDLALIDSLDQPTSNKDLTINQKIHEQNEEYVAINDELEHSNNQSDNEKESLGESEKHFRLMVEDAPDAIFIQTDQVFSYINKKGLELFGADTPSQIIGESVYEHFHPDYHEKIEERIKKLDKKKKAQSLSEETYIRFNGSPVHVEVSAMPIIYKGKNSVLVFARNILEGKQNEIALKHSHELMQYIIKHDPNAIAVFDNKLNFIFVSERFLSDYNIQRKDVIGKHHYDVFPDIPEKWRKVHQRALKGEVLREDEDVFHRLDGSVDYTSWECRPWYQHDQSIGGMIIYTEVITERKKAERILQEKNEEIEAQNEEYKQINEELNIAKETAEENEKKYRRLAENVSDVVWVTDLEMNPTYISPSVERVFGVKPEDYLKRSLTRTYPPASIEKFKKTLTEQFAKEQDPEADKKRTFQLEVERYYADGSLGWDAINATFIRDEQMNPVAIQGVSHDITASKKAQKALEEKSNLLEKVFNNSFDLVSLVDLDGNYTLVGKSHEILGYDRNSLIGRNVMEFVHPDDIEIVKKEFSNSLQSGESRKVEIRYRCIDGVYLWFETVGTPLKDENGNLEQILFNTRNITDRKKAEAALKKEKVWSEKIVDNAPNIIIGLGERSIIKVFNHYAEKLTGYKAEEVIGKEWIDILVPDELKETIYQVWDDIVKNKRVDHHFENEIITKSGEKRLIEWSNTIFIENGKFRMVLSIGADITDRRKAEKLIEARNKEILRQNEEYESLNEEYKQTNEELLVAKEKAEEANRLKSQFLNNMSHEIRTPMNGIIGFSEMLNNPDLTDEERRYYIQIIKNSSHQLLNVIDDILEISTLEIKQEKLDETEFCLNDLLMEIFSIFNLKSKERSIPIYLNKELHDVKCRIISDKTKLHKILSNLLENALKFTSEGFIEFGYYREKANLILYVKDTGIGISPENNQLIFERFSQEDKEISSKHGGLGLGLSICKENALLLGGDITLDSEKGKGATFYLTIPYKPAQVANDNAQKNTDGPEKADDKYTILVAEDEEVNYLYIEALFKIQMSGDYNLIHAKNGKEAVEACTSNKNIALVLMDIKMPVMNGYEATEKIKSIYPDLPIIAQTAYSTSSDYYLALDHGCDDFISKPIDKQKLFEIITSQIARSGSTE